MKSMRSAAASRVVTGLCLGWIVSSSTEAWSHQIDAGDLHIIHPYVTDPGAPTTPGLPIKMVIRNSGAEADRLVSAQSPMATSISVHGTTVSGKIELPAHTETTIGPDGGYLMIDGLREAISGYQYFPITLTFEKAGTVEAELYVEDPDENSAQPHAKP